MAVAPRRSAWPLLALVVGVALVLVTIRGRRRDLGRAPLEPAPTSAGPVTSPEAAPPRPDLDRAPSDASRELATDEARREWAIWRELRQPTPEGKRRARARGARMGWRVSLTLELGELARAGSPLAVELLARLVADPGEVRVDARTLALALEGVSDPSLPVAVQRGFERLSAGLPATLDEATSFLALVASHAGAWRGRLLLGAYEQSDGLLAPAVLEVLARAPDHAARAAWLARLQETDSADRAREIARALLAWDDAGTGEALLALAQAPYRDAERRVALATEIAGGGSADVALALVTHFWWTRGLREDPVPVAAARACLDNPAIPRERLLQVVLPIAEELLRSEEPGARALGLELLSTRALASPLALDRLVQARPELADAGLRAETKAAIRNVMRAERARRRQADEAVAPDPVQREPRTTKKPE